jgi:hypothetical protein
MNKHLNSEAYWNQRFSSDWIVNQGDKQSIFFSLLTIDNLPSWFIELIKNESLSVVDWGCAEGDGTNVLASFFTRSEIHGIDFSLEAINRAKEKYPNINFKNENLLDDKYIFKKNYDILYSSNTLEHFENPLKVLSKLSKFDPKAIILALPYNEIDLIDEHFSSFDANNIEISIEEKFTLRWARVVNCRDISSSYWMGDQIILVYINNNWKINKNLKLEDCTFEKVDTSSILNENKNIKTENLMLIKKNMLIEEEYKLIVYEKEKIEHKLKEVEDSFIWKFLVMLRKILGVNK